MTAPHLSRERETAGKHILHETMKNPKPSNANLKLKHKTLQPPYNTYIEGCLYGVVVLGGGELLPDGHELGLA